MTECCRASIPGATWFFAVNLAERKGNRLLVEEVDSLRKAFRSVQAVHAFRVDAAVILPDHLHIMCVAVFTQRIGAAKSLPMLKPAGDAIDAASSGHRILRSDP